MKAGSPIRETMTPFKRPKTAPVSSITRSTAPIGSPLSISVPPIRAEQIATVPIERSIPPVEITKVVPIAIKAT